MSVQLGNIASNNIYRDDDKPYYHRGNSQLFAINIAAIAVFLLAKACKSSLAHLHSPSCPSSPFFIKLSSWQ